MLHAFPQVQSLSSLPEAPDVTKLAAGYVVTARYGSDDARAALTPEAWVNWIVDARLEGIADVNNC
jgi:hypothetical protein